MKYDVIVVGAGIIGLACAYKLLEANPKLSVLVLEKESSEARHQSSHNSGVLHAGLFYKPGTQKALLAVNGIRMMVAFCRENCIPYEQCGKVVIATESKELESLNRLWERGVANGLSDLRRLNSKEIKQIEPNAAGIAGIFVPEEGIVDYPAVCNKLVQLIRKLGGTIIFESKIINIRLDANNWILETNKSKYSASKVITCAGLHSDRMVKLQGINPSAKIIPFRGEYYKLKKQSEKLVRNLIYPVPDPRFPFLGVHFTRMINGGVEAGPNAVLALAREGYSKFDLNLRDICDYAFYPGLWKFLVKYPDVASYEIYRSISKKEFCRSLQKLLPSIHNSDLELGGSGVRAQAINADGYLVDDFEFYEHKGMIHVINAPSPAATASLAIGNYLSKKLLT